MNEDDKRKGKHYGIIDLHFLQFNCKYRLSNSAAWSGPSGILTPDFLRQHYRSLLCVHR